MTVRPSSQGPRPARLALAVLVAATVALGACGSSGRELAEVPAGQTAPPRSTSSTAAPATTAPLVLNLTSTEWTPGGALPEALSCDGDGRSPALTWTGVPTGTAELAIVVQDPDAEGFVHWIVTGIAPTDGTVAAGELPVGALAATNDGGDADWAPVCPPQGEEHLYTFELLALAAPAEPLSSDPAEDYVALQRQATYRSALTGTFGR
jgi:Raf kinase inhibitor-like YbhB/YbcL family protein